MTEKSMCELAVILADLIKKDLNEKEWLLISEMSVKLDISPTTLQTYKERKFFNQHYVKYSTDGCLIKNCPEAIKLLQSYKTRDFEYEKELIRNEKLNSI